MGTAVSTLCNRSFGFASPRYYRWRAKIWQDLRTHVSSTRYAMTPLKYDKRHIYFPKMRRLLFNCNDSSPMRESILSERSSGGLVGVHEGKGRDRFPSPR